MKWITQAKGILLTPKTAWRAIDEDDIDTARLFTRYAMLVAAISPILVIIGDLFPLTFVAVLYIQSGYEGYGMTIARELLSVIAPAAMMYVQSLAIAFVLGLVINTLATTFGSRPNRMKSLKVAVYSMTATWVIGAIAIIVHSVAVLAARDYYGLAQWIDAASWGIVIISLIYPIYLIFTGLVALMNVPENTAVSYTAVVVLISIVLQIVLAGFVGLVNLAIGML